MMRESDAYMTVSPNFSPLFAGLGYGSALMVLGFVAAGAGHGTYVILRLSSSPLPLLAAILGIFGGPLVWGTIGGAFAFRRYAFGRRAFVGLLASHYAGL